MRVAGGLLCEFERLASQASSCTPRTTQQRTALSYGDAAARAHVARPLESLAPRVSTQKSMLGSRLETRVEPALLVPVDPARRRLVPAATATSIADIRCYRVACIAREALGRGTSSACYAGRSYVVCVCVRGFLELLLPPRAARGNAAMNGAQRTLDTCKDIYQ